MSKQPTSNLPDCYRVLAVQVCATCGHAKRSPMALGCFLEGLYRGRVENTGRCAHWKDRVNPT